MHHTLCNDIKHNIIYLSLLIKSDVPKDLNHIKASEKVYGEILYTLLHDAIKQGKGEETAKWLNQSDGFLKHIVAQYNIEHYTQHENLVELAAKHNHMHIVALLLNHSTLFSASLLTPEDQAKVLRYTLRRNAKANKTAIADILQNSDLNYSTLEKALQKKALEAAINLHSDGANSFDYLGKIFQQGANVNLLDQQSKSLALRNAVAQDNVKLVKKLIEIDPNIDIYFKDEYGKTNFDRAADNKSAKVIGTLINAREEGKKHFTQPDSFISTKTLGAFAALSNNPTVKTSESEDKKQSGTSDNTATNTFYSRFFSPFSYSASSTCFITKPFTCIYNLGKGALKTLEDLMSAIADFYQSR